MLFYISVFLASVVAALVIVYLYHAITGIFRSSSSTLVSGSRNNQRTYYRRATKKPAKRRDKTTPWGWGNSSSSAKVAGPYSASSRMASSGGRSTTARRDSGSGTQKASGFNSFLKNNTVTKSRKTGPAVRTHRKAKAAPWGW